MDAASPASASPADNTLGDQLDALLGALSRVKLKIGPREQIAAHMIAAAFRPGLVLRSASNDLDLVIYPEAYRETRSAVPSRLLKRTSGRNPIPF